MNECQSCDIEAIYYEHEPTTINYVFAALNPDQNSIFYQDSNDYYDWLFSCSCYYKTDEDITIPKYNLNDNIWFNENKLVKNFDDICIHIKKCYLARRINRNHIYDTSKPLPNWIKTYFGKNYIKISKKIIDDLKPIRWGTATMRHGIGKVKIYDYNELKIILYKNNIWSCNCSYFEKFKNCSHILKYNNINKALQNRRELGISLALKYIENNCRNN